MVMCTAPPRLETTMFGYKTLRLPTVLQPNAAPNVRRPTPVLQLLPVFNGDRPPPPPPPLPLFAAPPSTLASNGLAVPTICSASFAGAARRRRAEPLPPPEKPLLRSPQPTSACSSRPSSNDGPPTLSGPYLPTDEKTGAFIIDLTNEDAAADARAATAPYVPVYRCTFCDFNERRPRLVHAHMLHAHLHGRTRPIFTSLLACQPYPRFTSARAFVREPPPGARRFVRCDGCRRAVDAARTSTRRKRCLCWSCLGFRRRPPQQRPSRPRSTA